MENCCLCCGELDRALEMGIYHMDDKKNERPFFVNCVKNMKITQHPVWNLWITPSV